jgi:hypothetical protein
MCKKLFIKTQDENTAKQLKTYLELLSFDGATWIFLNDINKKMNFDSKKIIYSDKLCF